LVWSAPDAKRIGDVRRLLTTCAVALLVMGPPAPGVAAQASGTEATAQMPAADLVEVRLKDGSVIYGVLLTAGPDRLVIRTLSGGVLEVERAQIASLEPARGEVVNGEFRPADANATRLLFAPTGRALNRGEGYVGVYGFLLPFVQVGITDRLSMGAGTPLLFFGDESSRPLWLTPKYQFYRSPRASAAAGVLHFVVLGDDVQVGLAYAVGTFGSEDNALTAGVGWAYAHYYETEDDPSCVSTRPPGLPCEEPRRTSETVRAPVVMVGGERRLSRRVKLVTENYLFEAGGVASLGVRFLGDRLSADLGMFAPLSSEEVFLAPIVNFVWTFGR
jgi:hypothetical protein